MERFSTPWPPEPVGDSPSCPVPAPRFVLQYPSQYQRQAPVVPPAVYCNSGLAPLVQQPVAPPPPAQWSPSVRCWTNHVHGAGAYVHQPSQSIASIALDPQPSCGAHQQTSSPHEAVPVPAPAVFGKPLLVAPTMDGNALEGVTNAVAWQHLQPVDPTSVPFQEANGPPAGASNVYDALFAEQRRRMHAMAAQGGLAHPYPTEVEDFFKMWQMRMGSVLSLSLRREELGQKLKERRPPLQHCLGCGMPKAGHPKRRVHKKCYRVFCRCGIPRLLHPFPLEAGLRCNGEWKEVLANVDAHGAEDAPDLAEDSNE